MGFVDDTMIADASAMVDAWGESVVYTPPGTSPTPRTINAIIDRKPPKRFRGGNVHVADVEVWVMNSATLGIASTESIVGGTITLAVDRGRTAVALSIRERPIDQDAGMICISF